MKPYIHIEKLSKSYASTQALKEIQLDIYQGELFGVIGADGAGKSTLLRLLATLIDPDKGSIHLGGDDLIKHYKKVRQIIGYMPGQFALYQDLSILENLNFFASIFGTSLTENRDFIDPIYRQIEPFKNRLAGKLSGGMKQKLALCCALIHKPKVLILDEPTTGVDPTSRKEFWEILQSLKKVNITTLVSTPYMDEAILCDRVALMKEGQFFATNTPQNIISSYPHQLLAVKSQNMGAQLKDIRKIKGVINCFAFGDRLHVALPKSKEKIHPIQKEIESLNYSNTEIFEISPSIEDCFLAYHSTL